MQDADLTQGLK